MRYSEAAECGEKKRYGTKVEAKVARGKRPELRQCRAYRCSWCKWWHLGHPRHDGAVENEHLLRLAETDPEAAHRLRLANLGIEEQ